MSEAVINDALARMNEPEVKDRLKATTQEALDLGVSNLTGATGEFSSPGSTFYADSYFGIRSSPCYRSSTNKIPVILPKLQVAGYR